jgi:hypothetical protein
LEADATGASPAMFRLIFSPVSVRRSRHLRIAGRGSFLPPGGAV